MPKQRVELSNMREIASNSILTMCKRFLMTIQSRREDSRGVSLVGTRRQNERFTRELAARKLVGNNGHSSGQPSDPPEAVDAAAGPW